MFHIKWECTTVMINFRIYKYQWSLQLAVYLLRRERWANLHFLRVKWEMFRVYGKPYLFQLTYSITWYMSLVTWQCYNNFVARAQGVSLKKTFLCWIMIYFILQWWRHWNVNFFMFAEVLNSDPLWIKKSSGGPSTKNLHMIINISTANCYIFDSQFLPNFIGITEEQESTNQNNSLISA